MRVAIVSDIHGNRTAFEAVLADIRDAAPDLVLHGGDLADGGSSPVQIVDGIRDLGWPGIIGNGEEALAMPETLEDFARQSSAPPSLWSAVREMMAATRALLGAKRLEWLKQLPRRRFDDQFVLVHAAPDDPWRAPAPDAFERVYGPLGRPVVIYGHIHRPFVEAAGALTVANSGSVGLPYDGDPRASYLLLDDGRPTVRRVPYDIDREVEALTASGIPHGGWVARMLRAAGPQMP